MSTKQKLVVALVVVITGLGAVGAARSAYKATSCQKPTIVAGHWFAYPSGSQYQHIKYQLALNTHAVGGNVRLLAGGGVADELPLAGSNQMQTVTLIGEILVEYPEAGDVGVQVSTNCGSVSRRNKGRLPQSGYFGDQTLLPDPDFIVIDNRGSGEGDNFTSPPGAIFASKFKHLHPKSTLKIINDPYPAPGSKIGLVAAFFHLPGSAYAKSVKKGQAWLQEQLMQLPAEHPGSMIFVAGYSQGADVASEMFFNGNWENVGGLLMFGDPHFTPGDSFNRGSFEVGYWGALGVRFALTDSNPYVLSYCHAHDPVCQGVQWMPHYHFSTHTNYDELGEPEKAAIHFTKLWG